MLYLVLSLLCGGVAGRLAPDEWPVGRVADRVLEGGLLVLLAMMGVRMGASERVVANLGPLGFRAVALAAGSIAGSVLLVAAAGRYLPTLEGDVPAADAAEDGASLPALVLAALLVGGLFGWVVPSGVASLVEAATTPALYVLLVAVGATLAAGTDVIASARRLGPTVLVLPLCVALGSIAGAMVVGVAFGMASMEAAAVGAGFGWYSLSGVLVSDLHGVYLGSLTFLANVLRELLTFLVLPFVVRRFGRTAGIAPGGATTMDVTLPAVRRTAGREAVVPAVVNGVTLSLLVPILVPALVR
ncbi:lysine exporter LysO family protein [Halarchaeum sp. P4]|uniref:lysine exporter LysO family protein n=1 Tax=Halarchaeum sp. P4 TaxID=3421639 RepID=UPI003EB7BB1E